MSGGVFADAGVVVDGGRARLRDGAQSALASPPARSEVAVFCRSFLPISQTFVYDAVTRLSRYQATVFCLLRENARDFPYDRLLRGWPSYRFTRYSPNFARAIRRDKFSLVHAQFGTTAVYALPYAQRAKLPLVVSFHGYEVPLLRRAHRFFGPHNHFAWYAPSVLRSMTLGLCASSELCDMLVEHGVARERLRIHRLGVDTARFAPSSRAPHASTTVGVLMVGRLVEKKSFADGIAAFASCVRKHAARLTIVGDGPLRARLSAQVAALGIEPHVHFVGAVPHATVLSLMQANDVLIAPSAVSANGDRDSGLIALREAASAGLASIVTRHGGLPDSVEDGVTGYLVDEHDVAGMAERLERLLGNADLRVAMGAAARSKMVREFDHTITMPVLEHAYDEARALHAGRAPR